MSGLEGKGGTSAGGGAKGPPPRDILFFGDSLTWGMAHKYTGRYDRTWPRIIERRLNARGYNVVESALCSRTTSLDDPSDNEWLVGGEPHDFNGTKHFLPEFLAHECRAVVILLGTNDLKVRIRAQHKFRSRLDAQAIANSCAKIGLLAMQAHKAMPRLKDYPLTVVLVSPPVVKLNQHSRDLGYDETSVRISLEFSTAYKRVCQEHGFQFVEVPDVDMSKSVDGVHVTPQATRQIAEAVWECLSKVLERRSPLPSFGPPDTDSDSGSEDGDDKKRNGSKGSKKAPGDGKPGGKRGGGGAGGGGAGGKEDGKKRGSGGGKDEGSSKKPKGGGGSSNARPPAGKRQRVTRNGEEGSDEESGSGLSESGGDSGDSDSSGGSSGDEEDRVQGTERLIWNQCRECNKWRMASPISMEKAHWTCKDEFWSDRLEEWKVGCGWSMDPYKDDPNVGSNAAPKRGAFVKVSRFALVREEKRREELARKKQLATREREKKRKEKKSVAVSKSKAKKPAAESATNVTAPAPVAAEEAPPSTSSEEKPSLTLNSSLSVDEQPSETPTLVPNSAGTADQPAAAKKKRGRPPGVPNKPKLATVVLRPQAMLPAPLPVGPQPPQKIGEFQPPQKIGEFLVAGAQMQPMMGMRGPVMVMANPTMAHQPQHQGGQQQKGAPPTMFQPNMFRGYPTMVPMFPPGFAGAPMFGHPMMRPAMMPMIPHPGMQGAPVQQQIQQQQQHMQQAQQQAHAQAQQQQQAQAQAHQQQQAQAQAHQQQQAQAQAQQQQQAQAQVQPPPQAAPGPQQAQSQQQPSGGTAADATPHAEKAEEGASNPPSSTGSDAILKNLVPFVERVQGNFPQQLQGNIGQLVSAIKAHANSFVQLVTPFAELRQVFTSIPPLVQELDAIAMKHPQLAACYSVAPTPAPQMTAPPMTQVLYWPTDAMGGGMSMGFMPQPGTHPQGMPVQYIQLQPSPQMPQAGAGRRA